MGISRLCQKIIYLSGEHYASHTLTSQSPDRVPVRHRQIKEEPAQGIIVLPKPPSKEEAEARARAYLSGETLETDTDVIEEAIKIAYNEGIDVVFKNHRGATLTPEMAYRLRYYRGLDILS